MTDRPLLTYYNMGDGVTAFSTTRHGGCSKGSHATLNINPYCGDDPQAVSRNLLALSTTLGIEPKRIVMPHQTHGIEVRSVDSALMGMPPNQRTRALDGIDAISTDMTGVCIGVSTADCIPVLLSDREHHAVCAVHAGWRGTVARIVQKAVQHMQRNYATVPSQLVAQIGPGISLQSFEVGDEVYAAFSQAGFDMQRIARRQAKWHIDLPLCNAMQLQTAGVEPSNIAMCGTCTYQNAADYFSARRLGTLSGRIFTGIMMQQ